jgi:hypothetical protein
VLRPLRTHLAALTKANMEQKSREAEAVRVAELKEKRKEEQSPSNASPDWLTRALSKRKALKKQRTYAARPHAKEAKQSTELNSTTQIFNGEIQVPLVYMSSQDREINVNSEAAANNGDSTNRRERRSNIRKWKFTCNFDEAEIRVVKSYVTIMLSVLTHGERKVDQWAKRKVGPRSLRCTAISQIPVQIEQEEVDQLVLDVQDRYDPIEALYESLDGHDLAKYHGVCFQAQILRAYATKLVCNAIRSQRLHFAALSHYLSEYGFATQFSTLPEMYDLKSAAIFALQPDWKKKNCLQDNTFQTLINRLNLVDGSNQTSKLKHMSHIRMFSTLLDNPTFPIDWLGTASFNKHWQDIIIHASSQLDQYYDTIPYVVRIVRLGCGIEPILSGQSYTLNYVSTLDRAASNCDNCRPNHGALPGQRSQLQSAFTRSLSCLFTILPALVLVGSEEYTNRVQVTSPESYRYKPKLLAIRSLLQSCSYDIFECKHLISIKIDKPTRDVYAIRSNLVLFSTLLTILAAPLPINYTDVDLNDIVRNISWIEGISSLQSHADNLAEQLVSICQASSQMSGSSPESFLDYLIGRFHSNTSLSRRYQNSLRRIWDKARKKMNPNAQLPEIDLAPGTRIDDDISDPTARKQITARTDVVSRNCQLDRSLTSKSSLSTQIIQNCRWDSMIDEWIALTPARPSWRVNKALVVPQTPNIEEENRDIDELDISFRSQDETLVELIEQKRNKQIDSSPPCVNKISGRQSTGRISDLIPSSSPSAESPAAIRGPIEKHKPMASLQPSLRVTAPKTKGQLGNKRTYSSEFEFDSESGSDDFGPEIFTRPPSKKRAVVPISTHQTGKKSDLMLRYCGKPEVAVVKRNNAPARPIWSWVGEEDELS